MIESNQIQINTINDEVTRRTLEQFNILINNIPAMIGYIDCHEKYTFANVNYENWYNKKPGEILGLTVHELIGHEAYKDQSEAIKNALLGRTQKIFSRTVRKNNEIKICSNVYTPNFDKNGKVRGLVVFLQDRTEDMNMSEQLRNSKEAAEAANLAKSTFLANMSHEIRSPLAAIMGFAELLAQPDHSSKEIENYIAVINRNSSQLLRIIDDILDLSKVEAGKISIESIDFSLPDLLTEFSSLMGQKANKKGIQFEVSSKTAIPDLIKSDLTRLKQILENVVGNAIKFTEKGHVKMTLAFSDNFLNFTVTDTGLGISPDQSKCLFKPFMQADASTNRKYGGTGLGLALTRRLCEALGGEFHLEQSKLGFGSTFVFKIKVETLHSTKILNRSVVHFSSGGWQLELTEQKPLLGMNILLVEDSVDNQTLIDIVLTKAGAKVDIASDGSEGVAKSLTGSYNIVLMDVQMPKMDGHEATKILRSNGYQKPIVALTAHAMKEERERCQNSGFSDFLTKPLQREAMLDLLEKLGKRTPA